MMTKEQFVKRISLIQNFHSSQETLQILIQKLTDGHSIVDFGNELVDEIVNMISKDIKINENDDLISWWLYESVNKVIYDKDDNGKEIEIKVETVEQLYDYLI